MALTPAIAAMCVVALLGGSNTFVEGKEVTLTDVNQIVSSYDQLQVDEMDYYLQDAMKKYNSGSPMQYIINNIIEADKKVSDTPKIAELFAQQKAVVRLQEQAELEKSKEKMEQYEKKQAEIIEQLKQNVERDRLAREEALRQQNEEIDYSAYYTETSLNQEEYDMICAVVQAEAGGGTLEFREYVAGVIFNRLHSPYYPSTVYDVLHAPGQFTTISNYYDNTYPVDDITREAVSRIFDGVDLQVLYNLQYASAYCNPYTSSAKGLEWFQRLTFVYEAKYPENDPNTRWVHWFFRV